MTQSFHSDQRTDSERMRTQEFNDDDPIVEDPRLAAERADERERAVARDNARERADGATRDGSSLGTSYLGDGHTTEDSWQQWRKIQADFVDSPREAVAEANGLVGELIDNIVRQFNNERSQMEQRWSSGEDVSTEELRKCLQTYRDFFGRLLAQVEVKN